MATYKYTTFANFPPATGGLGDPNLHFIGYDTARNTEVTIDAATDVNSAINLMLQAYNQIQTILEGGLAEMNTNLSLPLYKADGVSVDEDRFVTLKFIDTDNGIQLQYSVNTKVK